MLKLSVRQAFFDTSAVLEAVGRARAKALTRIGGHIRTTAQRSIRRRKGPSAPGSPPHAHKGQLRKFLFFSYDARSDSVVVGPALLPGGTNVRVGGTIPAMLELGGAVGAGRKQATEARVEARPYMGPALGAAARADKLSKAWKDAVR